MARSRLQWRAMMVVSLQEARVLTALVARADDGQSCYPSEPLLAANTGMTIRNVRKASASLEARGILRRRFGERSTVTYYLATAWMPDPGQKPTGGEVKIGPGGRSKSDRGGRSKSDPQTEPENRTKNTTTNSARSRAEAVVAEEVAAVAKADAGAAVFDLHCHLNVDATTALLVKHWLACRHAIWFARSDLPRRPHSLVEDLEKIARKIVLAANAARLSGRQIQGMQHLMLFRRAVSPNPSQPANNSDLWHWLQHMERMASPGSAPLARRVADVLPHDFDACNLSWEPPKHVLFAASLGLDRKANRWP